MTPAGAFIAKYRPGSMMDAAISAITATDDSISMEPYPIIRTCVSFWIIFGVVPEEMRSGSRTGPRTRW